MPSLQVICWKLMKIDKSSAKSQNFTDIRMVGSTIQTTTFCIKFCNFLQQYLCSLWTTSPSCINLASLLLILKGSFQHSKWKFAYLSLSKLERILFRGVARGGPGVPVTPPLVGLLLSKQPTIFRWRKCHDNILAVKVIVEKPTF